jgi:receptor expression-enhancing protein 5/6
MDKLKDGLSQFDTTLSKIDALNQIQDKYGVPRAAVVVVGGIVGFALMWMIFGPGLLTNLLGFAYPAYASFKAIESPESDDDTQWLTYWVVFSVFSLIEIWADLLEDNIPMYYPMKFAFLIYLFAPQTKGAEYIYKNFLRRFFLDHEKEIDARVEQVESIAAEVEDASKQIAEELKDDYVQVEEHHQPAAE